jgi:hypothetical protein
VQEVGVEEVIEAIVAMFRHELTREDFALVGPGGDAGA